MKKILLIFGTRPEAIKMAPLVKELQKRDGIKSYVCISAQHRHMLDQVIEVFDIKVDYDLNIMKDNQTLSMITTNTLLGVEDVIKALQPDLVLVHGDTTTTFASALASFYAHIPVGHVEAGLRTNNIYSPFPEELNRQLTGNIATLHFAPTNISKQNLLNEGKKPENIFVTGNTAIDALKYTVYDNYHHEILDWIGDDKLILLTMHRRENIGEPMYNAFRALNRILNEFEGYKVVYPVHLNPKVKSIANEVLSSNNRIKLIDPLNVVDFHNVINKSYIILTDSGGIQEEAPSLGKPVLVLRDTTERPEGVEAGTLKLSGITEEGIYNDIYELLSNKSLYQKMSETKNPYGDGNSSKHIVDNILKWFNETKSV